MAPQKEYFINSVELIDLQGSTNIPTVLLYRGDKAPLFGSEALVSAAEFDVLNEDFKVDLGNHKPGSISTRRFRTADGKLRSAAELTSDFIHELLQQVTLWLEARDIQKGTNVLVAEPLAMQEGLVSEGWLANYRNFVRRILNGKGFENIDFLPEPFAVYQYYRYQEKHPIVAERRKHYALVLDFGGGTFDACLIETTKEGDISQSGRQAKPLSACSEPIGGFFVNRVIAEELVRKVLSPRNIAPKINKALELYRRWRRDGLDITSFSLEYQNFIRNYHRLAYRVEEPKITLCRLIKNWELDAPVNITVPIPVPQDIFTDSPAVVNLQFSASELKGAFISKIWEAHLRPIIRLALQRGKEGLSGAPITVVLLSGGSANIRWLTELLRRDFSAEFATRLLIRKRRRTNFCCGAQIESE
jgi:molecular chaperone DnaK (HSP70)